MSKKLLSSAILALTLSFAVTNGAVFAEDGIMPINETNETMPINDDGAATPVSGADGEISEPTDTGTTGDHIDLEEGEENNTGTTKCDAEDLDENGNVIDSSKCTEEDTEEDESAMWPMYLSLGALGAAVLIFIILNLFGRKKH